MIARAAGGLLENVIDGVTGCLWEGGPEELAEAVAGFDTAAIDPQACIANAQRFDSSVFRESFPREVQAALREGPRSGQDVASHPAAALRGEAAGGGAGRFGPA